MEGIDKGCGLASMQEDGQGRETATHLQVLGDERGSKDGRKVARIIYKHFLTTKTKQYGEFIFHQRGRRIL